MFFQVLVSFAFAFCKKMSGTWLGSWNDQFCDTIVHSQFTTIYNSQCEINCVFCVILLFSCDNWSDTTLHPYAQNSNKNKKKEEPEEEEEEGKKLERRGCNWSVMETYQSHVYAWLFNIISLFLFYWIETVTCALFSLFCIQHHSYSGLDFGFFANCGWQYWRMSFNEPLLCNKIQ